MSVVSAIDDSRRRAEPIRGLALQRDDVVAGAFGIVLAVAVLAFASATGSTLARLNDFYREAWPAYQALTHGHILGFVRLGPPYVGSLVMRAPLALMPSIWGGGERWVYFASALPCVLAAPIFVMWLGTHRLADGDSPNRIWLMLLVVLNPIFVVAVYGGHPEEILGAVLCVAGVVLAVRGRVGWAGILLGLAVINKTSALVAVPVALVVATAGRRQLLAIIAVTAASVLIPVELVRLGGSGAGAAVAGGTGAALGTGIGTIFNQPQLLWWFGADSWIAAHAHEAIVFAAVGCAALWWWACRAHDLPKPADPGDPGSGARGTENAGRALSQALLLLAIVCLLRCALDPWNNLYYHLPFLLSLLTYEVCGGRKPRLTLLYTVVLVVLIPPGLLQIPKDARAAAYGAFVIVTIAWMVAKAFTWTSHPAAPAAEPTRGTA